MKKATIITLPSRHVIVIDGKIAGFGSSRFTAITEAEARGAEQLEHENWDGQLRFKQRG